MVLLWLWSYTSCLKPPDYSVVPFIQLDSVSKVHIQAGFDSVTFFIYFTDGDGDIGSDTEPNLFMLDDRTGYTDSIKVPYINPPGTIKAISGTIAYTRSQFICIPGRKTDSVRYTVQLQDRAGNLSNAIVTPTIYLQCP